MILWLIGVNARDTASLIYLPLRLFCQDLRPCPHVILIFMPSVHILSNLYFMNGFDIRKYIVNFYFSSNESLLVWDASNLQIKLSSTDLRKNDILVSMLIPQFKLP